MADTAWTTWGRPILMMVGLSLLAFLHLTIITLPVSFVMNRTAYTPWGVRAAVGLFSVLLSPVIFLVMWFFPKTHYFGMFPVEIINEDAWYAGILKYFAVEIKDGGAEALMQLALNSLPSKKKGDPLVDEELFAKAREEAAKLRPESQATSDTSSKGFRSDSGAAKQPVSQATSDTSSEGTGSASGGGGGV